MSKIRGFKCTKCGKCCRTLTVVEYKCKLPCLHLDLEKNTCKIYEDRCDTCKNYPHSIEFAIKTGCNGYWPDKK